MGLMRTILAALAVAVCAVHAAEEAKPYKTDAGTPEECGKACKAQDAKGAKPPPPEICPYAPAGLVGVSVQDVAYTVAPAQYQCTGRFDFMQVWCTKEEDKNGKVYDQFWYCCGSACDRTPERPEPETCKVQGKTYEVGQAYDTTISIDGKKTRVTLWCTTPDKYRYCIGSKCGSTWALTPPGMAVIPPNPQTCDNCVKYGWSYDFNSRTCVVSCKGLPNCANKASQCVPQTCKSFGFNPNQCPIDYKFKDRQCGNPGQKQCSWETCCEYAPQPIKCNQWNRCSNGWALKPRAKDIWCTRGKPVEGPGYAPTCSDEICCDKTYEQTTCGRWNQCDAGFEVKPNSYNRRCYVKVPIGGVMPLHHGGGGSNEWCSNNYCCARKTPVFPNPQTCPSCTKAGFGYDFDRARCVESCQGVRSCAANFGQCPSIEPPGPGPVDDGNKCHACTKSGKAYAVVEVPQPGAFVRYTATCDNSCPASLPGTFDKCYTESGYCPGHTCKICTEAISQPSGVFRGYVWDANNKLCVPGCAGGNRCITNPAQC